MGDMHVLILFGSEGVFDIGVAAGVPHLHCQRELLPLQVLLHPHEKHLQLLVVLRLVDLAQVLMKSEFLVHPHEEPFNCVDFCLSVGWNFQVKFLEVDDCMLRLDEFSVEVCFGHDSEEDVDSEVGESASELNFVVPVAALFAGEGSDDDFSEEGDFGEEEGGFAILLAVGAETFDDGGWVGEKVRSSSASMLAKMTSGSSFFFIMAFQC